MEQVWCEVRLPIHIFSYLLPKDLAIVAQVCKGWEQLSLEQELWQALFEKEYWLVANSVVENFSSWKEKYCYKNHLTRLWKSQQFTIESIDISAWYSSISLMNGHNIVTGHKYGNLQMWKMSAFQKEEPAPFKTIEKAHAGVIRWLRAKKDLCASVGEDGLIQIWRLNSDNELQLIKKMQHVCPVWTVDFSVEEDLLVCGCRNGHLVLWKLSTGARILIIESEDESAWWHTWINSEFIIASFQNKIHFFDLKSHQLVTILEGHDSYVMTFCLDYQGLIMTGGEDQLIRGFSLKNFKLLWTLHTGGDIHDMKMMDKKYLIAAVGKHEDFTVCVWEINTLTRMYDINIGDTGRVFHTLVLEDKIVCCCAMYLKIIRFREATPPKESEVNQDKINPSCLIT